MNQSRSPSPKAENLPAVTHFDSDSDSDEDDVWWAKYDNDRSLCVFARDNAVRVFLTRIVDHPAFGNLVLFLIIVNTVTMAINCEDYFPEDGSGYKGLEIFDYTVNVLFTIELIMRVISMGLYFNVGAYLQFNSYRLDFFVVLFAWLNGLPGMPNLKALRALRALRALKALRFLNQVMAIIDSVEEAIPLLQNVGMLFVFLLMIYSIMGTQILAGAYRTSCQLRMTGETMIANEYGTRACTSDTYMTYQKRDLPGYTLGTDTMGFECPTNFECVVGDNDSKYYNFDNVGISAFTIFQVASLEGWSSWMMQAIDGQSSASSIYFISVIILFTNFTLQLFTAVMFLTFSKIRQQADQQLEMDEYDEIDHTDFMMEEKESVGALVDTLTFEHEQKNLKHEELISAVEVKADTEEASESQMQPPARPDSCKLPNAVTVNEHDEGPLDSVCAPPKLPSPPATGPPEAGTGADAARATTPALSKLTKAASHNRSHRTSLHVTASRGPTPPAPPMRVSGWDEGQHSTAEVVNSREPDWAAQSKAGSPGSPEVPPFQGLSSENEAEQLLRSLSSLDRAQGPVKVRNSKHKMEETKAPLSPCWEEPNANMEELSQSVLSEPDKATPPQAQLPAGVRRKSVVSEANDVLMEVEAEGWDIEASDLSLVATDSTLEESHDIVNELEAEEWKVNEVDREGGSQSGGGSGAGAGASASPLRSRDSGMLGISLCSLTSSGIGSSAAVHPLDVKPSEDMLEPSLSHNMSRLSGARSRRTSMNPRSASRSRRGSMVGNDQTVESWRQDISERFAWIPGCLLSFWYRQDPTIEPGSDPPRCIEPLQFDNPVGHVIAHSYFGNSINLCIVVNCVFMSMEYYEQPQSWTNMISWAEVAFFFVFLGEMITKWIGLGGVYWYFSSPADVFDFVLVMASIPSAVSTLAGADGAVNLSVLRLFRMARVLRAFRALRAMKEIIDVVTQAAKAIANLLVFIFVGYVIAGIFTMQLMSGEMANECRNNFDCFGTALITLFIIMSGEDWNSIMYCTWDASVMGGLVVLLWFFFSNFILLNMFSAIILENFALTHMEKVQLQVMVYVNEKRKKFQKEELRIKLEEVEKQTFLENASTEEKNSWFRGQSSLNEKDSFIPEWEVVNEDQERKLMEEWEVQQFSGLTETEKEQYCEIVRLEREEAELDTSEEAEKLQDQSEHYEETLNGTSNVNSQIAKAAKADQAGTPRLSERELKARAAKSPVINKLKVRILEAKRQGDNEGVTQLKAEMDTEMAAYVEKAREDAEKVDNPSMSLSSAAELGYVEKSFYFLEMSDCIRKACFKISSSAAFEWFIIVIILISSALLAAEPSWDPSDTIVTVVAIADPAFLGIFTIEMLIKITACGFVGAEAAYLSDTWNRLDFFCVCMGYCTLMLTFIPPSIARVLRIGRTLRPLRMINKNERIQIVFSALYNSIPAIFSVIILASFMLLLFSIIGMNFFMGKFFVCNDDNATGKADCIGLISAGGAEGDLGFMVPRVWANPGYSFDNVFAGILTLYEITSLEGYIEIIWSATDITEEGMMPKENNHPENCLFFIAFICSVCYFILNLAIGVIIEKFNQMSGRGLLTEQQKLVKDNMLAVLTHDNPPPLVCPTNSFRKLCFNVTTNKWFEYGVLLCILINSGLMASEYYHMSQEHYEILEILNVIFVWIFTVEIVLRIIAQYPAIFFSDAWNIFDLVIVAACLLVMFVQYAGGDSDAKLSSLRPLRLLLIFRVIKRAKGIRLMVATLLISLPAMINVATLLFLLFFLYAIIGMQMFGNVKFGTEHGLGQHANFRYFGNSMLLLFRVITGENWNLIMKDCMVTWPECTPYATEDVDGMYLPNDCGSEYGSIFYFCSFYAIATYTVMNLFIAIVIDNFSFCYHLESSDISTSVLEDFRKKWYKLSLPEVERRKSAEPKTEWDSKFLAGMYMPKHLIHNLLLSIGTPMGLKDLSEESMTKLEDVMREIEVVYVPRRGVSYIQLQKILVQLHAGLAPLPIGEYIEASYATADAVRHKAADRINSIARGRLHRKTAKIKKQMKAHGKLKIKVIEANGLRPMDLMGKANPQIRISQGKHQHSSTESRLSTLEPAWGQVFYVDRSPNDNLLVEVLHTENGSKFSGDVCPLSFMGAVSIDIQKLQLDECLSQMFDLEDPEGTVPTACERDIIITVHQARGLQIMDSSCFGKGSSDPFVKIRHGEAEVETSVRRSTTEPVWDEVLVLGCNPDAGPLHVSVFDYDLVGGNDDMGSGLLEIPTGFQPLERCWMPITDENGQDVGEVEMSLVWRESRFGSLGLEVTWVSEVESTVAGRLLVNVSHARNLVARDNSIFTSGEGSSDPLVKIAHGQQTRETRCIWNTLTPKWGEKFKFTYDTLHPLMLTIEDFDLAGNDFMGQVKIKLDELVMGRKSSKWYKLESNEPNDSTDFGEIYLEILWKDNYHDEWRRTNSSLCSNVSG